MVLNSVTTAKQVEGKTTTTGKVENLSHNPYQAPLALVDDAIPEGKVVAVRETRKLIIVWVIIFLLNLPFPVAIGSAFTTGYSIWAMVATLVVLVLGGIALCIWYPSIARPLVVGSAVTAVSQIVPILHVAAGLFGVEIDRTIDCNSPALIFIGIRFGF